MQIRLLIYLSIVVKLKGRLHLAKLYELIEIDLQFERSNDSRVEMKELGKQVGCYLVNLMV